MDELSHRIESYLLERGGWVPCYDIVRLFALRDDRVLRQVGDSSGLCSSFAISSEKGLKHVRCATTSEWLRFKHRLRRHGIGELVRVRDLDHRRRDVTAANRRLIFERDSGQALIPEVLGTTRGVWIE